MLILTCSAAAGTRERGTPRRQRKCRAWGFPGVVFQSVPPVRLHLSATPAFSNLMPMSKHAAAFISSNVIRLRCQSWVSTSCRTRSFLFDPWYSQCRRLALAVSSGQERNRGAVCIQCEIVRSLLIFSHLVSMHTHEIPEDHLSGKLSTGHATAMRTHKRDANATLSRPDLFLISRPNPCHAIIDARR